MLVRVRARHALTCLLIASAMSCVTLSPFQTAPAEIGVVQWFGSSEKRSEQSNTIQAERFLAKNGHSNHTRQFSAKSVNQVRPEVPFPDSEAELQQVRQVRPVTPEAVISANETLTRTANETLTRTKGYTAPEAPCPNCLLKNSFVKAKNISDAKARNIGEVKAQKTLAEELEKLRIEEIKSKILKKLRMVSRPNVTIPRSMLPEPLQGGELQYLLDDTVEYHQTSRMEDDDYYGKTEKVIVIAENVDYPVCNGHHSEPVACFDFKLAKNVFNRDVSSAEMWVYKLRDKRDNYNQTYVVSELAISDYTLKKQNSIVAIREVSIKNGWMKFDITSTVRRWLQKYRANIQGLRISCKTCAMDVEDHPVSNDPGEKPFIVINFTSPEVQRRGKRSIDCQANTTFCCKETLYVNFTDIGWGDWVISPPGYYANYCKGTCMEDITSAASHHATVIQVLKLEKYLMRNKSSMTESQVNQLMPCCTATKTAPISIIYTNDKDTTNLVYNSLPNMMVEACGCK